MVAEVRWLYLLSPANKPRKVFCSFQVAARYRYKLWHVGTDYSSVCLGATLESDQVTHL